MSDDRERQGADGGYGVEQPPNVKPKPDSIKKAKKEKSTKVRRSMSTDSERGEGSGRRRERKRDKGLRRERGRSEENRRQDRAGDDSNRKASDPQENDMEDTECVVCFCEYDNVFKTPKLLSCGHTFCLECLARINVTSLELKSLSCPVCRELTNLPHGRNLPQLGNNQDIFRKLPPEMQRALSVRFKRSKGKLVLKKPPPGTTTLPTLKKQDRQASSNLQLGTIDQGLATVVDVGRPPRRVRGRLRRMFRSDQCYYTVMASIVTITVVLMLMGILAFMVMPNVVLHNGSKPNQGNSSQP
ncbi:E3 ubiquitin-protein ligase RNF183-like [Oncorhynchus tshawytscha]|uniref:RING-type domain-containing protein n=1 Tax=Oncorhynchus tshawytscha TaxID=74940 RepID=A0AAZ3SGT5_ONCTS|nr:E3 ubiquitin-protein ligase RNF183-like [Oncorhynchus tshawytscha]XP_024253151.1 E3 ubiquitin-protein ligase RNF183-like [Oncorhynchus tshawytscha]